MTKKLEKNKTKIKLFGFECELPFGLDFKKFIILILLFVFGLPIVLMKRCSIDIKDGTINYEKQNLMHKKGR
jgi:uncharacterized membrane protein